uniref:Uncharacterized protein n=1 Tax=Anguilla anguilla TaxID=7936 RepID=A0A0E9TZN2_ANGAN
MKLLAKLGRSCRKAVGGVAYRILMYKTFSE